MKICYCFISLPFDSSLLFSVVCSVHVPSTFNGFAGLSVCALFVCAFFYWSFIMCQITFVFTIWWFYIAPFTHLTSEPPIWFICFTSRLAQALSLSLYFCPAHPAPCTFVAVAAAASVGSFFFFSTLMAALDSRGLLHNEQFSHLIGYFFPRCVHALIICRHTNRYDCFYISDLMSGFIASANWRFDIATTRFAHDYVGPIGQPADRPIGAHTCAFRTKRKYSPYCMSY